MNPTFIDMSYFRDNLASIAIQVYQGKVFIVKRSDVPIMEVKKVDKSLQIKDPWSRAFGSWDKLMTDKEADKLIRDIYRLRKDGSSKKKNLWEP